MHHLQKPKSRTTPHIQAKKPFFSGRTVFPKLSINAPNDRYEREADTMADRVMRMQQQTTSPGHGVQRSPLSPLPPVQRACKTCQEEERVQRQEKEGEEEVVEEQPIMRMSAGGGQEVPPEDTPPTIQRACSTCEEEETVQREEMEQGEEKSGSKPLMRKAAGGGYEASAGLQQSLSSSKGSGSPLPAGTQSSMSQSFGVDFSGVRVHTGSQAQSMSQGIQAKAFTHGSDIYFNQGQYNPNTGTGQRLLAHELTHVVQQGGASATPQLQRSASAFWMPRNANDSDFQTGGNVHTEVQQAMSGARMNNHLFTEAPVPNAVKGAGPTFSGRVGYADFYKSDNNKLVGVFKGNGLESIGGIRNAKGRVRYRNRSISSTFDSYLAPDVKANRDITKVDQAPSSVKIADLKPFVEPETKGGNTQLSNYESGFGSVRDDINALPPGNRDNKTWGNLSTGRLTGLKIPAKYTFPTARGQSSKNLRLRITGVTEAFLAAANPSIRTEYQQILQSNQEKGKLYVMEEEGGTGIYAYTYFPNRFTSPKNIQKLHAQGNLTQYGFYTALKGQVDQDIVGRLKNTSFQGVQRKPVNNLKPLPAVQQKKAAGIQRKNGPKAPRKDQFDLSKWQKGVKGYEKSFVTKLKADKDMRGVVFQSVYVPSYLAYRKRYNRYKGVNLDDVPQQAQKPGKDFKKLLVWTYPGVGIIGVFRKVFGKTFIGLMNGFDRLKAKLKKMAARRSGGRKLDIVKAALQVAFKLFKKVAGFLLTGVLGLLANAFQRGVSAKLSAWLDSMIPEELEQKVQEVKALQDKYEELAAHTAEKWIQKMTNLGDKLNILELFEKAESIKGKLDKFTTIISLVRWGARIIACLSPPAIGCLWILGEAALNAAASLVIQTCWFGKKVFNKIIKSWSWLRNLPTTIAGKLVPKLNETLNPALPKAMHNLFADINANSISMDQYKHDCNEGGDGANRLTAERAKIWEIIEEIGEEKFKALLELANKRGAGPAVQLTEERLKMLAGNLKNVTTEQLKAAANDKSKGIPVPMQQFLQDIQKLTPGEKEQLRKDRERKRQKEAEKEKSGSGDSQQGGDGKAKQGDDQGAEADYPIHQGKVKAEKLKGKSAGRVLPVYTIRAKMADFVVGKTYRVNFKLWLFNDDDTVKVRIDIKNVTLKVIKKTDDFIRFNPTENFSVSYGKDNKLFFRTNTTIEITKVNMR